jgi:hypothetical protein
MARSKDFLLKLVSLFLFREIKAIPCEKLPRNWRSGTTLCNTPFTEQHKLASNQNRKRSGRPRCTTEQENKYIRVSSLRNRHLTSPQLAASWNSTRKAPVSTSTVKRRLWDAGLGCGRRLSDSFWVLYYHTQVHCSSGTISCQSQPFTMPSSHWHTEEHSANTEECCPQKPEGIIQFKLQLQSQGIVSEMKARPPTGP